VPGFCFANFSFASRLVLSLVDDLRGRPRERLLA
jgi:hypothetical protein